MFCPAWSKRFCYDNGSCKIWLFKFPLLIISANRNALHDKLYDKQYTRQMRPVHANVQCCWSLAIRKNCQTQEKPRLWYHHITSVRHFDDCGNNDIAFHPVLQLAEVCYWFQAVLRSIARTFGHPILCQTGRSNSGPCAILLTPCAHFEFWRLTEYSSSHD